MGLLEIKVLELAEFVDTLAEHVGVKSPVYDILYGDRCSECLDLLSGQGKNYYLNCQTRRY